MLTRLRSAWDVARYVGVRDRRSPAWELRRRMPAFPPTAPRPLLDDELTLVPHGSDLLAIDPELDAGLGSLEVRVTWQPEPYRLPDGLRELAPSVLRRRTGARPPFNGPLVRLETDLTRRLVAAGGRVAMRRAAYFDDRCSNELTSWHVSGGGDDLDLRATHLVDAQGRLVSLADSALVNAVGISTLALTTDRHVVVVHQSAGSGASPDRLAPSGSGGLEPRDLPAGDGDPRLRDVVVRGMERELREETGLAPEAIGPTWLVGYGRWLDRGARPEFFGVSRLAVSSREVALRRRPARAERAWVQSVATIAYDDAAEQIAASGRASLPLAACLDALRRAVERRPAFVDAVLAATNPWDEPVRELARGDV